jgi:YidC/Oxa1 family membrane protein insertase
MYGLSMFIQHGWAVVLFTVLVKLVYLLPKSFCLKQKWKCITEIAELGEKFKKEPMKKQQETMKLYNKAGVNP